MESTSGPGIDLGAGFDGTVTPASMTPAQWGAADAVLQLRAGQDRVACPRFGCGKDAGGSHLRSGAGGMTRDRCK